MAQRRFLLVTLTVFQPVQKFPAFYGIRRLRSNVLSSVLTNISDFEMADSRIRFTSVFEYTACVRCAGPMSFNALCVTV